MSADPQLLFFLAGVMAALGVAAGFLAGLLGVGGGFIVVPGIYFCLTELGFDPAHTMHVAVASSFMMIVPTGFASARAHHGRGAVDFDILKNWGPAVLAGVGAGVVIASYLSGAALKYFFAGVTAMIGIYMLFGKARPEKEDHAMPRAAKLATGGVIGLVSSLMGIGGATLSVPTLTWFGMKMQRAVGTASALGLVIAVPSVIGYMIIGVGQDGRPPLSLGYVNFVAVLCIVPLSVLMAPLGAKCAHAMPKDKLRRAFGVFVLLISLKMFFGG